MYTPPSLTDYGKISDLTGAFGQRGISDAAFIPGRPGQPAVLVPLPGEGSDDACALSVEDAVARNLLPRNAPECS